MHHYVYTDCLDGRTDAVARHVSFARITCCVYIYIYIYTVMYAETLIYRHWSDSSGHIQWSWHSVA